MQGKNTMEITEEMAWHDSYIKQIMAISYTTAITT